MKLAICRKTALTDNYTNIDVYVTSVNNFTRKVNFNGDVILCEPVIVCSETPPNTAVNDYIFIGYTDGLFYPLWQGQITEIAEQPDTTVEIKCTGYLSTIDQEKPIKGYGGSDPRNFTRGVWGQATGVSLPSIPAYTDNNRWNNSRLAAPQSTLGNLEVARNIANTTIYGYDNGTDIPNNPIWSKTGEVDKWLNATFYLGNNALLGMFFGAKKPLCMHKATNGIMPSIRVSYYCGSDANYTNNTYAAIGIYQQILMDWYISEYQQLTALYPKKTGLDGEDVEVYKGGYVYRDFNGDKVTSLGDGTKITVKQPKLSRTAASNSACQNLPNVKTDYDSNHTGTESYDQLSVASSFDFEGRFFGEQYSIFDPTHPNSETPSNRAFMCKVNIEPKDFSTLITSLSVQDIVCRAIRIDQYYQIETVHSVSFTLKEALPQLTFLSGLVVTENNAGGLQWCNLYPWSSSNCYPITLSRDYALSVEKQDTIKTPANFTFNFTGVFGDTYNRNYNTGEGDGALNISLCQGQFAATMGQSPYSASTYYCGANRWDGNPGQDGTTHTNGGGLGYPFKLLTDSGETIGISGFLNFAYDGDYSYTITGSIPSINAPHPFLSDTTRIILDGPITGSEPLLDISPVLGAIEQIKTIYGGLIRETYRVEIADLAFLKVQVGELLFCDLPYIGQTVAIVLEVSITLQTISLVIAPFNATRTSSYTKRSTL